MSKTHTLLLLFFILAVALVLRFAAFDHPLAQNAGEGLRDLFVAQHALMYGEWPLGGHHNGLSTVENSPLYYYIVIFFTLLGSTFLGIGTLYLLFQCAFIALVFFFTRKLFNTNAALIAAALLAVSPHYVVSVAGDFLWPPYFAAPFVVASLFALWHGYTYKKKIFTVASPILMLLALAIHQSTIAFIPLYAFATLYVAYKNTFSIKEYVVAGVSFLIVLLVLFIPPLSVANFSETLWGVRIDSEQNITSLEGIYQTIVSVPYAFGVQANTSDVYAELATMLLIILGLWFFSSRLVDRRQKQLTLFLVALLLSVVIVAIVFDPTGIPRHFEPMLWSVPVVLGVIMSAPFGRSLFMSLLSTVALGLLLFASLSDSRLTEVYQNIGAFDRPHYQYVQDASTALEHEVRLLKSDYEFEDYTFFNIETYGGTHFRVSDYMFWLELEKRLGVQLEKSPNSVVGGFQSQHSDHYMFFVCLKHQRDYTRERCRNDFITRTPTHTIEKNVFESEEVTIFLAKENIAI